jgi:hypothetical protein
MLPDDATVDPLYIGLPKIPKKASFNVRRWEKGVLNFLFFESLFTDTSHSSLNVLILHLEIINACLNTLAWISP